MPSSYHRRKLGELPDDVFSSGNRDGVSTEAVISKISSEANLVGRLSSDPVIALRALHAKL